MMKTFIKKWHRVGIEDDSAYTSDEYKQFAEDAKKALLRDLHSIHPDFDIPEFRIGHYDLSGFVSFKDKYVYFSHDVSRGGYSVDLKATGPDGWLYRTAKHLRDFTGGTNHFCETQELPEAISKILFSEVERECA